MLDSRLLGDCPEYKGSSANKVSSHIDEIDEDILLSPPISPRTVLVPRVQSMQEYILKHHKGMILLELNRQIRSGSLRDLFMDCPESVSLKASNCSFDDMAFWRCDARTLLVDVIIHVRVSVAGKIYAYDLYCELWADMRNGMIFTCGEVGLLGNKPQRDFWMLSAYLSPSFARMRSKRARRSFCCGIARLLLLIKRNTTPICWPNGWGCVSSICRCFANTGR